MGAEASSSQGGLLNPLSPHILSIARAAMPSLAPTRLGGAVKALTPKARPFCDRQVGVAQFKPILPHNVYRFNPQCFPPVMAGNMVAFCL